MASVILQDVVKRYGKSQVIHSINLEIKEREFVVLVGPSGCGKSTVLRMIAGLEEITAGQITIDDRVVNDVAPKDRRVSMVFQNYALYPHMNVYNNMSFGLKLRKTPAREIEERVRETARILGLEDMLKRKPSELSGGQRQRVAMGRAIVRKPSVFLFDEPLSNLDAKLRIQMRTEIKRLHQKVEATIVYVTHDQVEAMTLADRIVVIRDGHIEQVGRPLDLFESPVNTFVASFIGNPPMNLIPARIVTDGKALHLVFGNGGRLPIPERKGARLSPDRDVIMGIRTEDLTPINGSSTLPKAWQVRGCVEVVEPLGGETLMHMDLQGVKCIAKCDGRKLVQPGETLDMSVNLKHLHIFDAQSQQNIY